MKVLWLINIIMPAVAKKLNLPANNTGGWLLGQLFSLKDANIDLVVCHASALVNEIVTIEDNGVKYITVPLNMDTLKSDFKNITETEKPDVVHIFGTEFIHTDVMVNVCDEKKCVVSLQGIISEYAKHYKDGLPPKKYDKTPILKEIVRKTYYAEPINAGEKQFFERAKCEEKTLKNIKHVIGRTHWDKACAQKLCKNATYYKVNENLRQEFYTGEEWGINNSERHTIFVSQALYPIKGLHQLVKALPKIAQKYPDVKVYIGGRKPYSLNNILLDKFVDYFFEYQTYIKKLSKKLDVKDKLYYLGSLNATQMKEQYLKANVFVSPASIENSPNSVGEAMILGVPIVSSDVGGVSTMLDDCKDGLLYSFDDVDKLANSIINVFENDDFAFKLGQSAKKHALITHDRSKNTEDLLNVYNKILNL